MTDPRDQFIPYWLQTAMRSGTDGGLLGGLPHPDPSFSFPWEYPWPHKSPLDMWAQWPTSTPSAPPPTFVPPPLEHLDSGKYWPIAPAPSGAGAPPTVHGFHFPKSLSWDQVPAYPVPAYPAGSAARTIAERRSPSSWNVSAANPYGERGTSYGEGTESIPEVLSDVTPVNYWIPGADYAADGHHEFPREHYRRMPAETRRVFDEAKTGRLFVHSINGRRHEFDAFHRQYNKATGELLERFMKANNIADRPDLMTPDRARAVLKAITESEDPRIRHYGEFIRRLRLFYRLRGGDQ
jgi:hypothetical protein